MKKSIALLIVLLLCVIPFQSGAATMVKTEALIVPHKMSYDDFTNKQQQLIDKLILISENSPISKATYINNISDEDLHEYCLKETLDVYYGNLEKYSS